MQRLFISTSAGRLCCFDSGPRDRPAILFFHGWLGSPEVALRLHEAEQLQRYRLIVPYLPGHGESFSLPVDFTFRQMVQAMAEMLDALGLSRVILAGHSMGASLAWELAAQRPELVERVVLVNAFANPARRGLFSLALRLLGEEGLLAGFDPLAWLRPASSRAQRAFQGAHSAPRRLAHVLSTVELTEGALVHCPALLLWGREDRLVSLDEFRESVRPGTNVSARDFDGGHYWFWSRREHYVEALNAFLAAA